MTDVHQLLYQNIIEIPRYSNHYQLLHYTLFIPLQEFTVCIKIDVPVICLVQHHDNIIIGLPWVASRKHIDIPAAALYKYNDKPGTLLWKYTNIPSAVL